MSLNLFCVEGAPRSGTTLLQQIINSHPQAVCTHEFGLHRLLDIVDQLFVAEDEQNKQLYGLSTWDDELKANWFSKGVLRPHNSAVKDDFLVPRRARDEDLIIQRIFEVISNKLSIHAGGDKIPAVQNKAVWMMRERFPNLKTITIIRNPIDVTLSSLKRMENTKIGDDTWEISSLDEAIEEWLKNWEYASLRALEKNPNDLFIKYENLIYNFDREAQLILEHLDLKGGLENIVNKLTQRYPPANLHQEIIYDKIGDWVKYWDSSDITYLLRRYPNIREFRSFKVDEVVFDKETQPISDIFCYGFSQPEPPGGVWTSAKRARFRYRLQGVDDGEALKVKIKYRSFFKKNDRIKFTISANGCGVIAVRDQPEPKDDLIEKEINVISDRGWVDIFLYIENPKDETDGYYSDARSLGIKIEQISTFRDSVF